jgi:hypothetical protein
MAGVNAKSFWNGIFTICYGSMEPNVTFTEDNSPSTFMYVVQGNAIDTIDGIATEVSAGNMYDLTSHLGKTITHTSGPDGASWISINPRNKENASIQLVKITEDNLVQTIVVGKFCNIFTLVEGININGIDTKLNTIIDAPMGKVITITGQIGGVCAIYTPA